MMASKAIASSEEFGAKLANIIDNGFTAVSLAIGFDLGLFDVLAKFPEPVTSLEVAAASGMKERYVREWLGAMVTSRIVDIDATGEKFFMHAHQLPYLTKNGSKSAVTQRSSLLVNLTKNAFDKVKHCFPESGPQGTSYDDYPGKFSITAKLSEPWMNNHLAGSFISMFPGLKTQLENGTNVIDVGCGMGFSTCAFGRAFPKSRFVGIDFVDVNFQQARRNAEQDGLENCKFLAADVSKLPDEWANHFQYAFMNNVLHDLSHPMECLNELKRVLSPGSLFTVNDCNGHTMIKDNMECNHAVHVYYTTSLLACLPLSLGAGGMGLGSVCGKEKVIEILTAAGFEVLKSGVTPESNSRSHYYHCKLK